ncbi:SMI1/KNR4 family protein [Acaryochloris sp. IP29b_bin.137]|uniref:SMI1/KNR4 family protein n=1 Tax=Acaryochloris sp. IP29b_bin.137 TaxID=2969217 RepID=UPI0026172A2B|nr:SMI1/KNR4 family protein [Acaryochloris sp. IP29b_bin.137]
MSKLISALESISSWYHKHESRSVFRSGLSLDAIDQIVKALPFTIPDEIYELYEWCNGTLENDGIAFNLFYFLPLEEAVRLRTDKHGLNEGIEEIPDDPRWLPIFQYPHAWAFYIVVLGDKEESPVWLYDTEFDKYELSYDNLTNMLLHCADWLSVSENGEVHPKLDGRLQVKYRVRESILPSDLKWAEHR